MSDVIEPATTARSKCRRCGDKIEKGTLRFGEKVPNAFGEGDATHWFHLTCAAEKRPEKLRAALTASSLELPDRAALEKVIEDGIQNPSLAGVKQADRAPTGRATCQECRNKIDKGELRVAVEREAETMATTSYVHAACAGKHLGTPGLFDKLQRTSTALGPEDLAELERLLAAAE
jgi:hypothetical protein